MAKELNAQRDPRVDPRPGDVVARAYGERWKTRIVVERRGANIAYIRQMPSETLCSCLLAAWQEWCAHPAVQVLPQQEIGDSDLEARVSDDPSFLSDVWRQAATL